MYLNINQYCPHRTFLSRFIFQNLLQISPFPSPHHCPLCVSPPCRVLHHSGLSQLPSLSGTLGQRDTRSSSNPRAHAVNWYQTPKSNSSNSSSMFIIINPQWFLNNSLAPGLITQAPRPSLDSMLRMRLLTPAHLLTAGSMLTQCSSPVRK
ncbi:unnamed protein product [Gulo gulo]|uniref:Uncharacterized protein n=1 Tax=Gulo gulo TaxID=48420 RepID=A0A9X9PZV0_GULGU|nr:unnamed protein product [Gulo gulo]